MAHPEVKEFGQLYCLYIRNGLDTPIRITIENADSIVYAPPKINNMIIYIPKPKGLVIISHPQSDGQWGNMSIVQTTPFNHGDTILIGIHKQENKQSCDLTQRNLQELGGKYIKNGICHRIKSDGSFCDCPVTQHIDDGDWNGLKTLISKLWKKT